MSQSFKKFLQKSNVGFKFVRWVLFVSVLNNLEKNLARLNIPDESLLPLPRDRFQLLNKYFLFYVFQRKFMWLVFNSCWSKNEKVYFNVRIDPCDLPPDRINSKAIYCKQKNKQTNTKADKPFFLWYFKILFLISHNLYIEMLKVFEIRKFSSFYP